MLVGVPQSCQWSHFIHDIPSHPFINCIQYADITTYYATHDSLTAFQAHSSSLLNQLLHQINLMRTCNRNILLATSNSRPNNRCKNVFELPKLDKTASFQWCTQPNERSLFLGLANQYVQRIAVFCGSHYCTKYGTLPFC